MVPHSPPDPDSHLRVSEAHERARALADVLRDQEERARAQREAEKRRHRVTRVRRSLVAVVWAAAAYVWLFNPGWTRIQTPPIQPLVEDVRSLRINLFLQTQRVESFHQVRGRLPWVLQEAGPPLPGMEYRRIDNQAYELEGRSHRVRLRYASDRSALDFVGDAAARLTAGGDARSTLPIGQAESGGGP